MGFRPLARYIGLYHIMADGSRVDDLTFPSPLEVYRFISNARMSFGSGYYVSVPSRGIQVYIMSKQKRMERLHARYRPLSRYIGLYHYEQSTDLLKRQCFRPLSRQIGLYHDWCLTNSFLVYSVSVPSRGTQVYILLQPLKANSVKEINYRPLSSIQAYICLVRNTRSCYCSVTVPSQGIQVYIAERREALMTDTERVSVPSRGR